MRVAILMSRSAAGTTRTGTGIGDGVDPSDSVASALEDAGHTVDRVTNLSDAVDRYPVIVLLDASHVELVRKRSATQAVLVIAPSPDVDARVRALDAGADDVMSLPAHTSQMVARVGALGRRAALLPQQHDVVVVDGCALDLCALTATRDRAAPIALSELEGRLLRWLAAHMDRPVSRAELLQHVWGHSPSMETRTIDMTVAKLRKKIERDPAAPKIVLAVKNVGYKLGV